MMSVHPHKNPIRDRQLPIKFIKIETVIPVPFPVSEKIFDINLSDMNIKIHSRNQKRKVIPSLRDTIIPVAKWMENDRFGQISYMTSSFIIKLKDNKLIDELLAQEAVQKYTQKCVDAVNLVYTSYRVITGEHFPRGLSLNDIVELTISFSQDGGTFHEEIYYLGIGGQTFTSFLYDDHSLVEINEIINANIPNLPFIIELLINAEDFLREENYRMTVIEMETAVEYMISRTLNKYYNSILSENLKNIFLKELLNKRIDDKKPYLSNISTKITDGDEWNNWKVKCHDLRNNIIHKNKKPSKLEAENAKDSGNILIEILKEHSYDIDDWYHDGIFFAATNVEKAIKYLEKVTSINPNHHLALFNLGNLYARKDKEIARNYYLKSLKILETPECYFNLGLTYEKEKVDESIKNYDKSIEKGFVVRHPFNNPYIHKIKLLDINDLSKYQLDEVIGYFETLLLIFPHREDYLENLAMLCFRNQDYSKSKDYLTQLLILEPNIVRHYIRRAECEMHLTQKSDCISDLRKAIKIDPNVRSQISGYDQFGSLVDEL